MKIPGVWNRWLLLIPLVLLGGASSPPDRQGLRIVRGAASFDRSGFTDPAAAESVRAAGNLRGRHCCVSGWAEYDFAIEVPGWYQLWVTGGALEYLVDPPDSIEGEPAAYFRGGSGLSVQPDKVGNVWLEAGVHRVRVQTYLWNGFADFQTIELRGSSEAIDETVSIPWPRAGQIFRTGQCPAFDLLSGGRHETAHVDVVTRNRDTGVVAGKQVLELALSDGRQRQHFHVPCDTEGLFHVSVAEPQKEDKGDANSRGIKGFDYEVVDTARLPRNAAHEVEEPILSIDCLRRPPDYESADSIIGQSLAGSYRQSGAHGWVAFERTPEANRIRLPAPSWFAYALPELTPGIRYRIEIDYPDDADRTFGIFFREVNQHAYPVAIGVDTGGPYPVSNTMQTTRMTVWPRSTGPRLMFAPAHDGTRAACARIRVARVMPNEPVTPIVHAEGTREFVHWYEEGINFIDLFGARSEDPREVGRAIDRWAGTVAALGGTTLMPTVLVYGGQLYPSRYNLMEMYPDKDALRRIVLSAERFGLKVIPELHPRAEELTYGKDLATARKLLLVSLDGHDNYYAPDGRTRSVPPHYNVLIPWIQEWLIAMVGELADRYRDSAAFEGVSLRFMPWGNAALDNLVDLNWGYDDETIARFERETGIRTPSDDAPAQDRFNARHAWLTTTVRAAWVRWRCEQITSLLERVAARIRKSRPDLKLYVHVFPGDPNRPYTATDTPNERLLQAGIDVEALASLPAVIVIDSSASYGRNLPDAVEHGLLDALTNPLVMNSLRVRGESGRYITGHRYIEATELVFPPQQLGFPASTHITWASVAANQAGRSPLARLADELAEADALMLGDGGNGYVFAVPGLREFLVQYVRLPARKFNGVPGTTNRVVVRSLSDAGSCWLYAVNRSDRPERVEIGLSGKGILRSLSSNQTVSDRQHQVRVELPAYSVFVAELLGNIYPTSFSALEGPSNGAELTPSLSSSETAS